jgi:hypothetical protein
MKPAGQTEQELFRHVNEGAVKALLGMAKPVPLTPQAMARNLRVVFFPVTSASERVMSFVSQLRASFLHHGVTVLEFNDARSDGTSDKLQENLVIIAPGELTSGNLPVDHVRNLRTATVMGIVDGPCPADGAQGLQEKLNSVVKALAWNIVQVEAFVDDDAWTVCTMNGAIVKLDRDATFHRQVLSVLIPKLAAPVVPPHASDFDLREGNLDISVNGCSTFAKDFSDSGGSWAETGLMLFHTSLDTLSFRNRYYQRIAAAYLDNRSGMSYGFLARQMPVGVRPAMSLREADDSLGAYDWLGAGFHWIKDRLYIVLRLTEEPLVVDVPGVWVLTTRSGCDKSNVDVNRDLVLMGLSGGRVILETPRGVSSRFDCKPSYDTLTILSHAAGNAIVASLLARLRPGSSFAKMIATSGAALAHWHGLINPAILPRGYVVHGDMNPPVSCSTHQSAIYALTGKLAALRRSLDEGFDFLGDVHVEPYHGTNITGPSLLYLATWVLSNIQSHGVTQFSVQHVHSR